MRTKTLLLTAALAAAGAATSMAQSTIYSVNAVGYANVSVPQGFSMIACPFEQTSGDYSINTLIPAGNAGLQDASIYFFTAGHFITPISYDTDGGWDCSSCPSLTLGDGAFLLSPRPATVTFVGQVKQSVGGAPVVNNLVNGFQIKSSMIPQAGTLNTLQLFGSVVGGNDTLQDASLYQFTSGHYNTPSSYDADGKWDPDYQLKIGEAFFLLSPRSAAISRVFTVN